MPVRDCHGGRAAVCVARGAPRPVHQGLVAYGVYMSAAVPDLPVSDARQQLAAIIDRARTEHAPVYLARRGRRVAAVIDAEDLERILELAEDMADIRAAEEARAEMRATRETPIPWEQVKADLGLA
jgi:prevent-host-death family protein